ncbi:MAG: hypothetical protein JKX73_08260 [Flavobacteriales bacterium]|nr:hypothetical protein [Flavobacteriales bacterium]
MKNNVINILVLLATLAIIFLIGETSLRGISTVSADGNRILLGRYLRPYKLPLIDMQNTLSKYTRDLGNDPVIVKMKYDSLLGFKLNPFYSQGLFSYNKQGIRVKKDNERIELNSVPDSNIIRIALFGDSFTYCDEVEFQDSWGNQLENKLKKEGIDCEVLNSASEVTALTKHI